MINNVEFSSPKILSSMNCSTGVVSVLSSFVNRIRTIFHTYCIERYLQQRAIIGNELHRTKTPEFAFRKKMRIKLMQHLKQQFLLFPSMDEPYKKSILNVLTNLSEKRD